MASIFEHRNYRAYLHQTIESQPNRGWGFRSEIAQAIGCQTAYLSRILNGQAELSAEQTEALARFLGCSDEETDYLLLLVAYERAGTPSLKARLKRRIDETLEKRLVLKDRFRVKERLSPEAQATYYSAWYYAAVHVLISIPRFRTKSSIVEALGLTQAKVSEVLQFLVSVGLATEEHGRFKIGESRVHVGTDSPFLKKHLINWRLQAIQSAELSTPQDLHYSGIVTLSKEDSLKVRQILVKAIENANAVIAASPEEEMHCLNLDFFKPKT